MNGDAKVPPTIREIEKRIEHLRFGIGVACFLLLALGGQFFANTYIRDAAWLELFTSAWWIPSGLASYAIALASTTWITAPVKKTDDRA